MEKKVLPYNIKPDTRIIVQIKNNKKDQEDKKLCNRYVCWCLFIIIGIIILVNGINIIYNNLLSGIILIIIGILLILCLWCYALSGCP
tara:strand:- start:2528 stop:2791 length:264 start_codon:yes stop_codon:yes gene_type:complete